MALKITRPTDPITIEHIVTTVYSMPGIGRTTLGFTADTPLLLDFDGGVHRAGFRRDCVRIEAWSGAAKIDADDLKPYRTIVIDTVGRMLDCITADIIRTEPKMAYSGQLTQQGYGALRTRFIAYLNLLRSMAADVVLLAHLDEQRKGDDTYERLDIQGGAKSEVHKVSDCMGRLLLRDGKRYLNFNPTDTAYGKNPAQLPEIEIPHFQDQDSLARVIAQTKERLNAMTEAQRAFMAAMSSWQLRCEEGDDAALTQLVAEAATADASLRPSYKKALWAIARRRGFTYNEERGFLLAQPTDESAGAPQQEPSAPPVASSARPDGDEWAALEAATWKAPSGKAAVIKEAQALGWSPTRLSEHCVNQLSHESPTTLTAQEIRSLLNSMRLES